MRWYDSYESHYLYFSVACVIKLYFCHFQIVCTTNSHLYKPESRRYPNSTADVTLPEKF